MLSLACRDLGIMDCCEYVATGETEEELWERRCRAHNKSAWHERCYITPQFKESYKRYIKYS